MLISSILQPLSLASYALLFSDVSASAFSTPWSKRADGLAVNSPKGGESYATGTDINIKWTGSSSENVTLELRKGTSGSLVTVHIISSETINNGTYQWRSRDDDFLRAIISETLPKAPPSACDYVIGVRDNKVTAHSGYLTIINNNDDGLPDDAKCPDSKDAPPPIGDSNSPDSDGDGSSNEGDEASPGNSPDGEGDENSGSGEGAGGSNGGDEASPDGGESSSNNDSKSGTVTTAMLGGAVGGAAGGLILIFSAILLLGRSRGWFIDDEYIEKRVSAAVINIVQGNEDVKNRLVKEVTGAREIASEPIHQLPA